MRLAIMQPYFMPYIGYFQLLNAVDKFVVYDNIEYTKKGWINRNRILINGYAQYITVPLEKDSDFLLVNQRKISKNFDKNKTINQISQVYRKAPYYNETMPLIDEIIRYDDNNLFNFIFNSINKITNYLEIDTQIIVSSALDIDFNLKGEDKVLSICTSLNTSEYINPIGGLNLYSKENFKNCQINLKFLKTKDLVYKQFNDNFIPSLSILDVMMFNSSEKISKMLSEYEFN